MKSLNADDVDFDACVYNEHIEDEQLKTPARVNTTHAYVFFMTIEKDDVLMGTA